jgi:hypothetical protein
VTDDHADYLHEIHTAALAELRERFDLGSLREQDQLAVTTALMKASYQGFLQGVASYSLLVSDSWMNRLKPELRKVVPPDVVLPDVIVEAHSVGPDGDIGPEPDPWAEKYA